MLSGKVVLITGAAGLLGSAIVNGVVNANAQVILVDIDPRGLTRVSQQLGTTANHISVVADTSSAEGIRVAIDNGVDQYGKIDAAIHCAYPRSVGWGARFENLTKENLDSDLSAQLGGAILCSQELLKLFRAQGSGNLIHIGSIMGVATPKFENYEGTHMSSPLEYTAIKAALIAITKYLAKYYRDEGIRVNCISPGGILDQQPETFLGKYRAYCNEKGMLDPEDLVGTVLYLLSDESRYVNGQNIVVDDGWSL
jgi:NAD(P)-dependent dehydrogenase (short-subunit alcohol dehydrogenase family)